LTGPLVVLAWLPERATFWLLRKAGVEGMLTPSGPRHGQDARGTQNDAARRIWCVDLCAYERAEACAAAIATILASARSDNDATVGAATTELLDEPTAARWYPVIDYDRCQTCLECLNFCLFGVYGLDAAEAVRVEQPDACRPGCPACARVCPSRAILFPECPDPLIAGRRADPTDGRLGEIDGGTGPAGLAPDLPDSVEEPRRGETRVKPTRPLTPLADEGVSLDDLVDDLDDFDL
jgi:Pyruvate/2-oxoacid:ferredoxin oxidoreductase delta subunit